MTDERHLMHHCHLQLRKILQLLVDLEYHSSTGLRQSSQKSADYYMLVSWLYFKYQ